MYPPRVRMEFGVFHLHIKNATGDLGEVQYISSELIQKSSRSPV